MNGRRLTCLVLAGALLAAGCIQFGGTGRTSVNVDATRIESPPASVTAVPVENESIAGTPLESVVREAARTGNASETVPPETSDQVSAAQDALPRQSHPTADYREGTYVRVDETVVFVEMKWPA